MLNKTAIWIALASLLVVAGCGTVVVKQPDPDTVHEQPVQEDSGIVIMDDPADRCSEDPSDSPGLPPIEEEPWGAQHWHDTARKPDSPFKSVNK